jgi:peptidoglycan/LPS O-acetylase OafA/YrhL
MFFFLLSGFVLSLPFLRGKGQPYPTFISRRVLRIYVPYLGALALAIAGCTLYHNRLGSTGWAAGTWFQPVRWTSVRNHLLFIGDYNYSEYNTAFWSLVYEMRISLIFPFMFLLADRIKLRYTLAIIALCTLVGARFDNLLFITIEYIAVFFMGILLAKSYVPLSAKYLRSSRWSKVLLALASAALYLGWHRLSKIGPFWHAGDIPVAVGAAGLLLIGANSRVPKAILLSKTPAFLGRISYSLYLVHTTVLFAMAAALHGKVDNLTFFVIYVPLAIFLSWLFYLAVEEPFTYVSRKVGRRRSSREREQSAVAS